MLEHGGGLRQAARETGIPVERWLDLSTGINPNGWPVPMPPAEVWRRLPERADDLLVVAADYYETSQLVAVAGSQAAIQTLPLLRAASRVGLVMPTYAEHGAAWRRAGHQLLELLPAAVDHTVHELDVLLLVHPNNPTGQRYVLEDLHAWRRCLARRGGWLVVDEAFMDATPQFSLASACGEEGLVVLRSVGKFFGLAGLRLGFVAAWPNLLEALEERLGPWAVAHPARWAGALALADRQWQQTARRDLAAAGKRLAALLADAQLPPAGGTELFQWVPTPQAAQWHDALKRHAVLTRVFQEPQALRFGLPAEERQWQHLQQALAARG